MSNIKKLMVSAGGGDALDVDDVFSTYLYEGSGSTGQTISNNIDLGGEGGIIWIKQRDSTGDHVIIDPQVHPDGDHWNYVSETYAPQDIGEDIFSFSSTGFTIAGGLTNSDNPRYNGSSKEYASWTFRKAPKFFDVVTYTGNGASNRSINHNLGCQAGMVVVKRLDSTSNWAVWHKDLTSGGGTGGGDANVILNGKSAEYSLSYINYADASTFTVGGGASFYNNSGATFVAYIFAHNDGDGGFGPDSDQDIIKCGSYAGNSSSNGPEIDLGFEPQFVMLRNTGWSNGQFIMYDSMRGMVTGTGGDALLYPAQNWAESPDTQIAATPTGFKLESDNYGVNNNFNYVYMAIRRGSLFPPEDSTEVFAIDTGGGTGVPMFDSGFPVDFAIKALPYTGAHDKQLSSRLTGKGYGNVEASPWYTDSNMKWDHMEGYYNVASNQSTWISWMWKRAPGFCDVVAYRGTGATPTVINHNLSATPEMMWIKSRSSNENWMAYHSALGNTKGLILNSPTNALTLSTWNNTSPNETTFTLGGGGNNGSMSGQDYIAYLFATLPGISKVGSYTGDGTINGSKLIDCGFSNGPALVIIKIYEGEDANHWHIFDTTRGLVAGNDSLLYINRTVAAVSSNDYIDPHNSGFIVGAASNTKNNTNVLGSKYIFYAIAA